MIKNIFLIDDDPFNNLICEKIIEFVLPYAKVTTFLDGEQALESLSCLAKENSNNVPDLIFLDINMPLMDGWEFLEEYKKRDLFKGIDPDIYILSSSVSSSDIEKSKRFEVVKDFISKPLSREILNKIVKPGN